MRQLIVSSLMPPKRVTALPVYRNDLVARLETSLGRGPIGNYIADNRGRFRFADRPPHRPDDDRKNDSKQKTEERTGEGDDDFVERRNLRQLRAIDVRFALDHVHGRELRQRHEPAERQRTKRILHAVDRFFPNRFAEPDAKFFDIKATPARGQKMAKLVDNDEQIEKNQDLEDDEDDAKMWRIMDGD